MIKLLTATDVGSHGVNLTMRSWRQESASLSRCASSCCHMPTAIKGAFRDSETTFKSVGRCWMMLDDVFLCILPTSTDIYRPHRYKSLEWIECWRQEPSRTIFITCYYLLNPWTWAVSNLRQLLRDVKKRDVGRLPWNGTLQWHVATGCTGRIGLFQFDLHIFFSFICRPTLVSSSLQRVHWSVDPGKWWKMHVCASLLLRSCKSLRQWQSKHLETLGNMLKHV
jgi:hypothetical protein